MQITEMLFLQCQSAIDNLNTAVQPLHFSRMHGSNAIS
jgi:hypothetical protein